MFIQDPMYLLLMGVGAVLSFLPQTILQNIYKDYNETPNARGLTGVEVARSILISEGITDVRVESVEGFLTDHYDPTDKTVRLSSQHYSGRSIAGVAVAAHEVGHAIQHARGYTPVVIRSSLVPAVNIGSQLGPILFMISLGLGAASHVMPAWAWILAWVGVLLFGTSVLFHLVTLPVEIDASMRATRILAGSNYLDSSEMPGAKKVLAAAAFTYVAAALYSLIQLIYFVWQLVGRRERD
ncbi:MAG: zinc metallopeptidase [Cyanobacteria bacterium]|nr:zinc metallopeptidase [Cyanobacteriota bacterium]